MHARACIIPAICIALLVLTSDAIGGANPSVTLPMHAKFVSGGCAGYLPVDCDTLLPRVNVPPSTDMVMYIMINNYTAVAGLQTAFEWDPSWTLQDVLINCRAGQVSTLVPTTPGGQEAGTLLTSFSCVSAGFLIAIGRLMFTTGTQGCLTQVQSSYPPGIHVTDCAGGLDLIDPSHPEGTLRLGRICIEQGGRHACDPVTSVSATSWGNIKVLSR